MLRGDLRGILRFCYIVKKGILLANFPISFFSFLSLENPVADFEKSKRGG